MTALLVPYLSMKGDSVAKDNKRFTREILNTHLDVARDRFQLNSGQFFGLYLFKNLWWVLNDITIGYGDLRAKDLDNIQMHLVDGEIFLGWNEHHGSDFQQTSYPTVQITKDKISYPRRDAEAR
jgi:hypothetical protein